MTIERRSVRNRDAREATEQLRRERDRQIRSLWRSKARSQGELAEEYGLSQQRILQIIQEPDPLEALAQREAELQVELASLVFEFERDRRRIAVIRRTLDRIHEEREAAEIDKLLGLA